MIIGKIVKTMQTCGKNLPTREATNSFVIHYKVSASNHNLQYRFANIHPKSFQITVYFPASVVRCIARNI